MEKNMPNNLDDVKKATRSVSTETPEGQEHLTIQDYIDEGHDVVGWERLGYTAFVLYLA